MERQSHTEIVSAPVDVCFDTIVDFERYPEWFEAITAATVDEHDPDKLIWVVSYVIKIVKDIRYTVRYECTRPTDLTWRRTAGDIKDIEGFYRFEDLGDGRTRATCQQGIDVGFWVPGAIRKRVEKTALVQTVREFKAAAEAAHRVG